jgi:release factor glutamine methyltransferase
VTAQSEAQRDPKAPDPAAAKTPESGKAAEPWTIRRVLTWTQQHFAGRGLPSPRLDAELLLAHCLGRSRISLYTHYEQPLDPAELERFRGLIKRRIAGEAVAYLVGQKEFYGLPLRVSSAVLIPRPETELLVEEALRVLARSAPPAAAPAKDEDAEARAAAASALVPDRDGEDLGPHGQEGPAIPGVELTVHYDEPAPADSTEASPESAASPGAASVTAPAAEPGAPVATVVDVGTGSGAVALAIKSSRRELRVVAIDRSEEALAVAADNATRLGLTDVELLLGDLLAPLPVELRPELIVANLPYIPSDEIAGLAPEVRAEPRLALDGGRDGLESIRRLIPQAFGRLRPGGGLLLELGAGQAAAVESLLRAAGFVETERHADLAGIERVVTGRKP